ncbi:hypothetical protein BDN70DRAFT_879703 [Pholiota conissans]|uniref:Thioesterase domain-containing protein n=1 Tax=Pholiota conissans TaxID=109636 RepID=A0A9P5YZN5_9AGAR|nr:hypothetical protein BDN70DRAFT_879703 [Pholiota conissans]
MFSALDNKWTENARHLDVSSIAGNISKEDKQRCLGIFQYFIGNSAEQVYGSQVGERLKAVEMNVRGEGSMSTAQVVFEVTVEQDMCNGFNIMHGGCAAYIIDPCSVASLVILGMKLGIDAVGFSQSMHLIWHSPVKRRVIIGAKIRIVATSMSAQGRVKTARCEIWDKDILCVSAIHSTMKRNRRLTRL